MKRKLTGKGVRVRETMVRETAHIIREEGFKHATVRAIADRAKVNIASIRYYFGSKDQLIGEAIEYLMNDFEHMVQRLEAPDQSPKERLASFVRGYFQLANVHPALYRSISFAGPDAKENTYFIYIHLLHSRCWTPVLANIEEYTGIKEDDILEIKTLQLFAALEYPLILQSNDTELDSLQYITPEQIEQYIETLLDSLHPRVRS